MDGYLRQSTAATVAIGPFLDATDGVSEETGLSPAVELSKAGGSFASASTGTTAHLAEGWYDCDLDSTDTGTLGILKLKAHDSANHLPVWHTYMVIPQQRYDALFAGTDNLEVDAVQISGDSIAADTLELFAEALDQTTGQLDSGSLAAGAITAASIAADAIGASELAADAVSEIQSGLATSSAVATVDTVVDAIKLVTDQLPDGGALTTLLSNVAAILTDTGTTLPSTLSDIETDTQDIQSRIPAALASGNIKADVLSVNGSANAAARLALSAAQMIPGTVSTGTTAASTTVFAASDITEATADHFNDRLVLWTSGALTGQVTVVTDYELASGEGKFTVTSMTDTPSNGDTFLLV